MNSICIFGDSTSWGAWDDEMGGWVNRLWIYISSNMGDDYIWLYNCSLSGGTSTDILKRFESEAKVRGADALIFQMGGNDAAYEKTPGNYFVSPEKFKKNLVEIIRRAKKITSNIIFMDLKNCNESKTTPVSWDDVYYTNENIKKYTKMIKEACKKHGLQFLDIAPLNNKDFFDGLHPNSQGHKKIFKQVKDFLIKKKWIP